MSTETTEKKEFKEITLKFGKGLVGDPFTAKDGKEYKSIQIPNKDENDHRPWATFVVRANAVHEDQFGKGMWVKLPSEGHTTIRRNMIVGQDEKGVNIWDTEKTTVTNQELKSMVEFYKERGRDKEMDTPLKDEKAPDKVPAKESKSKESLKDRLADKKNTAVKENAAKPKAKSKAKEAEH